MEGPGPQTVKDHSPTRGHHPIAAFLHVVIGLISILLAILFGLFLMKTFFTLQHCGLPCPVGSGYLTEVGYLKGMAFFLAGTVFFWLVGLRLISGQGEWTGGGSLSLAGVVLSLLTMFFVPVIGSKPIVGAMIALLGTLLILYLWRRDKEPREIIQ